MKLYQILALSTMLFQSFICFSMQTNLIAFVDPNTTINSKLISFMHTKAKINSKNKQKIRNTQKAIAQLKAKTQTKPKIQRLLFPEPQRQQLINFCRIKLARKDLDKIEDETAQLKKETEHIREINIATNSQNTKLVNKINELERETKQLQEKLHCINQKKSIQPAQIKKNSIDAVPQAPIIQKTNQPAKRALIKRLPQNSDKPLTNQEKLNGLKILKTQYNAREVSVLLDKLREEADRAFKQGNPDFDHENHFFCKKINAKYRFVFCPCTRQLVIVNYDPEVPLPKDFPCSNNCSFYTSKSDTEEENLQPVLLSKEAIEKIAD